MVKDTQKILTEAGLTALILKNKDEAAEHLNKLKMEQRDTKDAEDEHEKQIELLKAYREKGRSYLSKEAVEWSCASGSCNKGTCDPGMNPYLGSPNFTIVTPKPPQSGSKSLTRIPWIPIALAILIGFAFSF